MRAHMQRIRSLLNGTRAVRHPQGVAAQDLRVVSRSFCKPDFKKETEEFPCGIAG